jgi:RNA polymerase sigma-70 factor (ECF subfamily)
VQEDDPLLAGLRAGDEAAFETLVRSHGGRMLTVARSLLRDEEDARDALQEAFASAFRSVGGFEGSCRLSTWLHRIVVNCCLMRLRRRKGREEESIEDLLPRFREDGHQLPASVVWEGSPIEWLEREEVCQLVRRSIDQLPEGYRTVLILRDLEELDTRQVADLLGMTENAVKVRLHRARQALRTLLDPHLRPQVPKQMPKGAAA